MVLTMFALEAAMAFGRTKFLSVKGTINSIYLKGAIGVKKQRRERRNKKPAIRRVLQHPTTIFIAVGVISLSAF